MLFPCLFCETGDLSKKGIVLLNSLNLLSLFVIFFLDFFLGNERSFKTVDKLTSDAKTNCGYKHISLIIDIPFSRFIIDILHQFLRISELLMVLLLDRLAYLDRLPKEEAEYNPEKHKCLRILSDFFSEKCGMNLIEDEASRSSKLPGIS